MSGIMQRFAQIIAGGDGIEIWPQSLHRLLAMQAMAGREREQLDELARLSQPPGGIRNRHPIDGCGEPVQQRHGDAARNARMILLISFGYC